MADEYNKEKTREQLVKILDDIQAADKFFKLADERYSASWVEQIFRYILIAVATAILGLIISNYVVDKIHPPIITTTVGEQTK